MDVAAESEIAGDNVVIPAAEYSELLACRTRLGAFEAWRAKIRSILGLPVIHDGDCGTAATLRRVLAEAAEIRRENADLAGECEHLRRELELARLKSGDPSAIGGNNATVRMLKKVAESLGIGFQLTFTSTEEAKCRQD